MVFIQWGMFGWFLWMMSVEEPSGATWWGRVTAMGLLCGVLGINVAHELGHRPKREAVLGAYALLLTSLYTHFHVEHNRGHHRNVATADDAATAQRGEWVWWFWLKAWWGGWWHAWQLEAQRLKRAGLPAVGLENEVLRWQVMLWGALLAVGWALGWGVAGAWAVAGALGGLLLETVNYIEHYGLQRERVNEYRYERVRAVHSWNSNHPLGRMVLFELSRHSDHHADPAKPYPQLDHLADAPQLPTGYPGMMVLSWLPPLFFAVVHPRLHRLAAGEGQ
jgi:alkane 1-monooxygenase